MAALVTAKTDRSGALGCSSPSILRDIMAAVVIAALATYVLASIKIQTAIQADDAMDKDTLNFAQQNTERAVQATNWMRAIAEQNLTHGKAAFEGLLTIARNAVRGVDQQASAICEHSMLFAEHAPTIGESLTFIVTSKAFSFPDFSWNLLGTGPLAKKERSASWTGIESKATGSNSRAEPRRSGAAHRR